MTPAARVLLVVLLLAVFLGGGFLLFRTLKKKKEEGSLFLLPNGDGTYRVEERSEKETYQNGRKERMDVTPMPAAPARPTPTTRPCPTWEPEIDYVPTNMNLFEVMFEQGLDLREPCPSGTPCRTVRENDKQDMLWYMQKLHQDYSSISVDYLRSLPVFSEIGGIRIVRENPLTIRDENTGEEAVLGGDEDDDDIGEIYPIILLVYKLEGRPLPKPVPTEDYRDPIWKTCVN